VSAAARPTLESVARHAQVSRQTVSNAINSPQLVHPETLARVQGAIAELGYRPHTAARQLRTRRSRVLGLRMEPVRDGINGHVLDNFLHALTAHAQHHGYRVMLFTAATDGDEIAQYDELLETADLDGFVLTSTHSGDVRTAWLAERDVPFVTFGRPWSSPADAPDDHPWVDVDGAAGTRQATRHLLDLGHRRIAFLGWPDDSDLGNDRAQGWREAMTDAGFGSGELDALRVALPDDVVAAAAATQRLLADAAPTAFVAVSDSLALGAYGVTRQLERPVAVVGFDDTPVAAALGLSSVAQPLGEAAGRVLDLLLRRLDGTPAPDQHVLLEPSLVARASSSRPAPEDPQNP
jgi:DNA-binding LacI/PurR family transcriptional regulator